MSKYVSKAFAKQQALWVQRQADVVRWREKEDLSFGVIAARLGGVSRQWAAQLYRKAKNREVQDAAAKKGRG